MCGEEGTQESYQDSTVPVRVDHDEIYPILQRTRWAEEAPC